MIHDGSYMVGMHASWGLFWLLMIGVWFFSGWAKPGRRGDRPRQTAHEVLSRRLSGGEINPHQNEERKALLDRDAPKKN